jgi:hypothetical protein
MTHASTAQSPLPHDSTRILRLATVILAGMLLLVLLAVFPYQHWDAIDHRSSILGGILKKAQQDSEWWFCLVSPFIVGWLVWRMKKSLIGLPLHGSWLGIPPLVLGMVFYWFGYKADTAYPGYLAAQLITLGLILQLGGTTLFPLGLPRLHLAHDPAGDHARRAPAADDGPGLRCPAGSHRRPRHAGGHGSLLRG